MSERDRKKLATLVQEARALVDATEDSSDNLITQARKRLEAVLDGGRHFYEDVCGKTTDGIKATDTYIHDNPYRFLGVGVVLGVILVCLLRPRR
ncbi:MAG: hypothetical protein ABI615_02580 [Chthoniobacterales bacterium]